MEFNLEKAKEIAQKHSLSEQTIVTWKSRNKIPDKYLKESSSAVSDLRILDKVREILKSEKINRAELARNTGLNILKLHDFIREKDRLNSEEILVLKKHLTKIRINGLKLVTEANSRPAVSDLTAVRLKDFLNKNPEIVVMKTFNLKKLLDWRNDRKVVMNMSDYRTMVDGLAVFCMEIAF